MKRAVIGACALGLATGWQMANTAAALTIVVGAPLLGLTFSLPGDGRIGFMIVALLWAGALLFLRGERELGLVTRVPGSRSG